MEKELLDSATERMAKAVAATRTEFNTVRSGRASTALLDRIHIDYYGTTTPLKQMATVAAPEPRLITVTPYDKSSMKAVEKAIMESDLGLNPSNDGNVIRLPIPPLNEERRRDLTKVVSRMGEEIKTAVRNVRRDSNEDVKKLEKDKHAPLSEDAAKKALEQVQKITDETIKEIEEIVKHKEAEIMHV